MPDLKGLPANLDAEKLVLGSILLDDSAFLETAGVLAPDHFSLEKHRRIYQRMGELFERRERIDRVTVAHELMRKGQLESVDGLGYLVSLDDGLPHVANLASYVAIVREASERRRLIFACQKAIDRSFVGEEMSFEIAASLQQQALDITAHEDESKPETPGEVIERIGLDRMMQMQDKGLLTPYSRLNTMTSGLHPGELIILAARPSMGKTALAVNIAEHVCLHPPGEKVVAIFSLEMTRGALTERMLCSLARVDSNKWRAGYLSHDERSRMMSAAAQMRPARLFIDDHGNCNVFDILSRCRRIKQEQGRLDLVVIDYLQLLSESKDAKKGDTRDRELGRMTKFLKGTVAKDMGVPVIALSQLGRDCEKPPHNGRPQLQHLRESGSIEADADVVFFIFREEIYKQDREDLKGKAEVILAKQRNGPIGKATLLFIKQYTKFEEMAQDVEVP